LSSISVPTPRPERALTPAQQRALLAMGADQETPAAEIAAATGMKPNGVALALKGLERRGLVKRAAGDDDRLWAVTFAGRGLAGRLAPKS
jgi:DNA-binding MarR family transcriptional regulator